MSQPTSPSPSSRVPGPLVTLRRLDALSGSAATASSDAVVIGMFTRSGDDGGDETRVDGSAAPVPAAGAEAVDAAFDGGLADLLHTLGATGKAEQVVKMPARGALGAPLLVAVGLGAQPEPGAAPDPDLVRRGAGAAARSLAGTAHVVSTLSAVDADAAVQGAVLGGYVFDAFRSKPDPSSAPVDAWEFTDTDAESVRRAGLVGEAVATARSLVNTPPSALYPETFAAAAAELGRAAGLTVEVLDDAELRDGGYGGVTGVGQGSSRGPRLVRLSWSGGSKAGHVPKVALIGKGITFDTGGISIKPAANMDHMTSDMGGAAAVIATTVLAARLELPVAVTATVPMAENMPSDTAYRPGDVLTMYGGTTVEVLNTDAEGRLILADAIVRAGEDSPDYLVETSTLTGAQQVALGMRTLGVMGCDELRDRVAGHARATGEDGWSMPLPGYLRSDLDSRVADIANVTGQRFGGMLVAGVFLREFVPSGLPWAHLDIAGPAFNSGSARGYTTKGGTGVPVRTLHALLEDIAANG